MVGDGAVSSWRRQALNIHSSSATTIFAARPRPIGMLPIPAAEWLRSLLIRVFVVRLAFARPRFAESPSSEAWAHAFQCTRQPDGVPSAAAALGAKGVPITEHSVALSS